MGQFLVIIHMCVGIYTCMDICIYIHTYLYIYIYRLWGTAIAYDIHVCERGSCWYGVTLVRRIDEMICFFCTRALWKTQYSAKETWNFIDPTDCSHPISSRWLTASSLARYLWNTWHVTATHCNHALQQHAATTHCNNTLQQHVATTHCNHTLQQHAATTHCNHTLQQHAATTHATTHCNNTLQQHTATTHCNNRCVE